MARFGPSCGDFDADTIKYQLLIQLSGAGWGEAPQGSTDPWQDLVTVDHAAFVNSFGL